MARPVHPDKDIEGAVSFAESRMWHFDKPGKSAHCWGKLLCPGRGGCCPLLFVYSTPRSAFGHAKDIRRRVNACPGVGGTP